METFNHRKTQTMATDLGRESRGPSTPTAPRAASATGISALTQALNAVLADAFGLYMKTKNFHWHVSGPHFRDYHLLFDEQASEILATTDVIAERVRKIGGATLRSIGHISRLQRLKDNDESFVSAADMLRELMEDNKRLAAAMYDSHELADEHADVATASLLEVWIDEAEKRAWFLAEASRAQPH
jgi:starvation-inducible DNA-binding protein